MTNLEMYDQLDTALRVNAFLTEGLIKIAACEESGAPCEDILVGADLVGFFAADKIKAVMDELYKRLHPSL